LNQSSTKQNSQTTSLVSTTDDVDRAGEIEEASSVISFDCPDPRASPSLRLNMMREDHKRNKTPERRESIKSAGRGSNRPQQLRPDEDTSCWNGMNGCRV